MFIKLASTLAWKLNIRRRWNQSIIGDTGHVPAPSISSNWAIKRALAGPEGGQEVIVVNWWRIAFLLHLQTCPPLTAEGSGGRDATVETRICATHTWMSRPAKKWEHHYRSSDPPEFLHHLCETSLVPHLVAQLWAGRNQGSWWCRWTARLGDAGSLAYLGRPGFSHEARIWPPHLKDRSKVWHPGLVVFIVLMRAGHWEASSVPRIFTPEQFEWLVVGTHSRHMSILPVLTPCVDNCWTECGRWSISLNNRHDEDILRDSANAIIRAHTLDCVHWHEQSSRASHPNSGMWLLNSHLSLAFWTFIGSLRTSSQGREPHNQWRRQKPKIWRSPRLDGSLERQESSERSLLQV